MKSNAEWLEWGRRDPLQGVATWPGRERGGAVPWTDEEFYALGAGEWADYRPHWLQYGLTPGHCLEFGCGAGRMTRALAEDFARVTAVDISADQLAYAQQRVTAPHVEFVVMDGTWLPVATGTASAFFSTYVFQHFSSREEAQRLWGELARVLAPGGTLLVQVPVYRLPDTRLQPVLRWLHHCERRLAGWKADWSRRRGRLAMRMLWYERDWLDATLRAHGFGQIEFRCVRLTANGHWSEIVLARRL